MIQLRKSAERGHFDHGWLDTHHTFSFSRYYDPGTWASAPCGSSTRTGCNPARASACTATGHGDRHLRPRRGAAHRDSLGTGARFRAGELQRMTAGTGITPQRVQPVADRAGPPLPDLAAARTGRAGAELRATSVFRGRATQPTAAGRLIGWERRLADDPPGRPALPRHVRRGPGGLA